jgi:hypothetical protein
VKLLFDHYLSPSLVARPQDAFPGSDHVWNLDLVLGTLARSIDA